MKITPEKSLIYILIFAVLLTFGFLIYLFIGSSNKSMKLSSPVGGEDWKIGETYKITWKAKGIDRVGIVLFKGKEPKWIAKNIPAKSNTYEWRIDPSQPGSDDYWIAVFEYPWQKGNKISYSGVFSIIYPELGTCETISYQNEWSYLPSDMPNIRRVFITENGYTGNLGGLDGADQKCQNEAQQKNLKGVWHAFIGGDSEQETAIKRLGKTPRKIEGIFIAADPSNTLIRGATCHRLLGKSFDEFLAKLSASSLINTEELEKNFLDNLSNIWLGRIDEKSRQNCIAVATTLASPYVSLWEKYSSTSTCQSWTKESGFVDGYPVPAGQSKPQFPTCYTPEGKSTDAVASAGLSSGLSGTGQNITFTINQGKSCTIKQKLICIEE